MEKEHFDLTEAIRTMSRAFETEKEKLTEKIEQVTECQMIMATLGAMGEELEKQKREALALQQMAVEEQQKRMEMAAMLAAEQRKNAELEKALADEKQKREDLEIRIEAEQQKRVEMSDKFEAEKQKRTELEMNLAELNKLSAGVAKKTSDESLLKALRFYANTSKRKTLDKRLFAKAAILELANLSGLILPPDLAEAVDHLDDEQPDTKVVNVSGDYNDIHDNTTVNQK